MSASRGATVYWLFGVGASIECGLTWTVPEGWTSSMSRDAQIARIKEVLPVEMDRTGVSGKPYRELLELLGRGTQPEWRHQLMTTNWDFLLQREVRALELTARPAWLHNSHVFHMNGTVEVLPNNANRSPFLLQEDRSSQRTTSYEAAVTYDEMRWGRYFVVVGMSFECDTDKSLLQVLGKVSDTLVVGESHWIVINPDPEALRKAVKAIRDQLPQATITPVERKLGEWLSDQMRELRDLGVLAF